MVGVETIWKLHTLIVMNSWLHLAFIIEMHCIVVGHRVYIVIYTVDALHISLRLCYFTLSASFYYLFFTKQTQE